MAGRGKKAPKGIQSVVTAFRILEHLAQAPTSMGLKALADAMEMPASKLRFYLVSFLELGLVSQDAGSARYSLGPGALRLGLSALEKIDVVRMVRDEMASLADELGYTVFLAVWGTHGPTIIDRVDGLNKTVLEIRVGSVLPLLSSATGRVYTAFMPRSEIAPILRRERRLNAQMAGTNVEQDPSLDFATIKQTRFAKSANHLLAGFTAIASPVLDRAGSPVAVLTVVGACGRLPDDINSGPAQALLTLTTRLSHQLGWSDT